MAEQMLESASNETLSAAESLKEQGNLAFKEKQFDSAIESFSAAIALLAKDVQSADASDSTESAPADAMVLLTKCLVNRSLCKASLERWQDSADDARIALRNSPKNIKAHYRLIKALLELEQFRDARTAFASASKACGHGMADLKSLEEELLQRTGLALNPKPTDFEILGELGEGNFTKIYKAMYRPTGVTYAIKTIEKMTIERMKKRHPNINNEILMEKRALIKLSHPGIVNLFCTFQDYGTLYYQMEYVAGRDLWELLQEYQLEYGSNLQQAVGATDDKLSGNFRNRFMVGCLWSQACFYFAEAIAAIEFMHKRGIAHRDIKPENMIIGSDGHLKFVDFGTAKDFVETDLNGPEFVGTPEYMSPETVRSSKRCGIAVDIWAMGVVLFQMLLGYTPFHAASPYLIFLRIKRSYLRLPQWLPPVVQAMLRGLLQPDPQLRLKFASGLDFDADASESMRNLSYDALRQHPFFSHWNEQVVMQGADETKIRSMLPPANIFKYSYEHDPTITIISEDLPPPPPPAPGREEGNGFNCASIDVVRDVYSLRQLNLISKHEIFLRALAQCCLIAAATIAENGGTKPADVVWLQNFDMLQLPALDRQRIMHLLRRHGRLHSPGVYRLFFSSAVEARALRTQLPEREFLGLSRSLQGEWTKEFHFMQIAALEFEAPTNNPGGEQKQQTLRNALSAVNKLRPKFLVVIGNFTNSSWCEDINSPLHHIHQQNVAHVRRNMARLSESIAAIYVPGDKDVGSSSDPNMYPTPASLAEYRQNFGADYFAFWYGGVRCLVLNSTLMIYPQLAAEASAEQDLWLTEELEQSKLCATSICVFTYHPWFHQHMDEDNEALNVADNGSIIRCFPKELRLSWLKKMRHRKVQLTLSSVVCRNVPNASEVEAADAVRRPFIHMKRRRKAHDFDDNVEISKEREYVDGDVEPPKPSEIVAMDGRIEDPDKESVASDDLPEGDESESGEEENFFNEHEDYEGPKMLSSYPLGSDDSSASPEVAPCLRAVFVEEYDTKILNFPTSEAPRNMGDLLQRFEASSL